MKIGIELNGIIRDLNSQIIKYYKKDIDKQFDDEKIDKNVNDLIDKLGFKGKKEKFNFMYIDYPYEIFGCANTMEKNLMNDINNFIIKLDEYDKNSELSFFSSKEEALSIQSTYFFLSKTACRVRNVLFPKDTVKLWDDFDIIITNNPNLIKQKPENKIGILILNNSNKNYKKYANYVFEDISPIINTNFIFSLNEIKNNKNKNNLIRIWERLKKFF